ncbi:hypothetical protein J3459_009674 [Metarhizium acridum]|nr:hypothetical protein J3459_009674 [Metarhizium acridum]
MYTGHSAPLSSVGVDSMDKSSCSQTRAWSIQLIQSQVSDDQVVRVVNQPWKYVFRKASHHPTIICEVDQMAHPTGFPTRCGLMRPSNVPRKRTSVIAASCTAS